MNFGLAGLGKQPLSEPFTCYIVHQGELDEIVNEIVRNYEDGITSEDSFAYNKLTECADTLTDTAIKVLSAGRNLIINSFQYREMFNESHPEYQINNWDVGWQQIKA